MPAPGVFVQSTTGRDGPDLPFRGRLRRRCGREDGSGYDASRFLLERGNDVAVGVQRERDGGVTQLLTDHLRVDTLSQEDRRHRMPQVM
jgi:hypothetical protein